MRPMEWLATSRKHSSRVSSSSPGSGSRSAATPGRYGYGEAPDQGRRSLLVGRLPGVVAADEVGDLGDPSGPQQRGRDGRAVAAGAVHDDRSATVEVLQAVEQAGQRHLPGGGDGAG